MTEISRDLFKQAARGDREAFWQLVLPYRGLIYSVALGMLKSHERADEQLHDVLLAAFSSLPSLRDPAKLPSWLYSITRHRIMDQSRKDKRLRQMLDDFSRGAAPVVVLAEIVEKEAWLTRMEEGLLQLPEPFRIILALKYMNDYSCNEIATILELSVSAVKSRLFEARKLLRKTTEALALREEKGHEHEMQ